MPMNIKSKSYQSKEFLNLEDATDAAGRKYAASIVRQITEPPSEVMVDIGLGCSNAYNQSVQILLCIKDQRKIKTLK
jgi:hypothetical protein